LNQDIHLFQQRFAESIRTPLIIDDDGGHVQPHDYSPETLTNIEYQSELKMAPHDRLAIYNQQYWFRLITTFQEEYPLTLMVCGLDEFNVLVMSYLEQFPSQSPYLRYLSQDFIPWLTSETVEQRIIESATLDFIFIELFDAPDLKTRQNLNPESLKCAPTMKLYHEHHPWVKSRRDLEGFELEQLGACESYWVIERNPQFNMESTQLSSAQYQLLSLCQQHQSIPKAVEYFCETVLGDQETIDDRPAQEWFQTCFEHWGSRSWFVSL
jgi:hypothetical protein